jgi:hypothetical protein
MKNKGYQIGSKVPQYGANMQMLVDLGKKSKERQAMMDKMKGMNKSEKDKYITDMRQKVSDTKKKYKRNK